MASQQEYNEISSYADELSAERHMPYPCGVFSCGKRYATREELRTSRDGKELGCPGGDFGWCVVTQQNSRRRRARVRLGEDD